MNCKNQFLIIVWGMVIITTQTFIARELKKDIKELRDFQQMRSCFEVGIIEEVLR
jgi:hypothetical protein